MKSILPYLRHPIDLARTLLSLPYCRLLYRENGLGDLARIAERCKGYLKDGHYDFEGVLVSGSCRIGQDMFFNLILPHISGSAYGKHGLRGLYRRARKEYRSIQYFRDNPFHRPYNQGSLMCHGWAYFTDLCQVTKGDIVLDLGASPGDFSALAAYRGARSVFAFDPDGGLALRNTADLNKNIIVVEPLIVASDTKTNERVRLDDYIARKGIARVDFIKMDIEGAELVSSTPITIK